MSRQNVACRKNPIGDVPCIIDQAQSQHARGYNHDRLGIETPTKHQFAEIIIFGNQNASLSHRLLQDISVWSALGDLADIDHVAKPFAQSFCQRPCHAFVDQQPHPTRPR